RHRLSSTLSVEVPSPLSRSCRNVFLEIPRNQRIDVCRRALTLADSVRTTRVIHEVERLAQRNQAIHEHLSPREVNIVVARTMDDQKIPAKSLRKVNSRSSLITLRIG